MTNQSKLIKNLSKYFIIFRETELNDKEKESIKDFVEELSYLKKYIKNFIKKVSSFEDYKDSIIGLVEVYLIMKLTWYINYKYTLLFLTDLILFYGPLETRCPHFILKGKLIFIQTVEGIIGILFAIIPRYEEKGEENKKP